MSLSSQKLREAWYRYVTLSSEEKEEFKDQLGLHADYDIVDHNDPNHPFGLDIGGEG
jgi:hypothetical protein|tara:strand:+ start:317 stop:487 length:171 start_codon:yes stop_codon:yes gene_type:complete